MAATAAPAVPNSPTSTEGEIGLGAAGLGILGSLGAFGGGGTVTNPYGGNANQDYQEAGDNLNQESGAGEALASTGESALGQYDEFAPQANQATENELNYLDTNPYTSTYDQAQLSQATGGAMQGFAQARSQLAVQEGTRGVASPGGTSSALTGADAGIDAAEAGTLAGSQNAIALQAVQQRASNLAQANQVAAQHSGMLFNQGEGATAEGSGILGQAASGYDTTGNDYLNEGQQQIQDTTAANNAGSSGWAGLAGIGLKVAGL